MSLAVSVAEWQQGDKTRPLDGRAQLSLVLGAGSCYPAGYNFPGFGDVITQHIEILVIYLVAVFRAEPANFFASYITCHIISRFPRLMLYRSQFVSIKVFIDIVQIQFIIDTVNCNLGRCFFGFCFSGFTFLCRRGGDRRRAGNRLFLQ